MSKKITKQEIRKELSKIKALDKASDIVIADEDLRDALYLKMYNKMRRLIKRCIEERNLNDYAIESLSQAIKDMESHVKEDDEDYTQEIFFTEEYKLHAEICCAITEVEVYCGL